MADTGTEAIRIERAGGDGDRRLDYRLVNGDSAIFVAGVSPCSNHPRLMAPPSLFLNALAK